ncbi:hypothetical protein ACFO6V_02560 [Promicromonospora alba]|uniref:DDE family transposase n=1 Tax=Promicromonospora alba TaxID=1616110 RepID=A0ABV9HAY5_9MICO
MTDQVLVQVPDENKHTKILVRIDGAGASHDAIAHLEALNHFRRRVAWTIGWTITEVLTRTTTSPRTRREERRRTTPTGTGARSDTRTRSTPNQHQTTNRTNRSGRAARHPKN